MGSWRADQSKGARRKIWGQTRGELDLTRQEFANRLNSAPSLASLRIEKIGSEIHAWREIRDEAGAVYWASCLRFVDQGLGYWTVLYRPDERRWRATPIKNLPMSAAITAAADWLASKGFTGNDTTTFQ